MGVEVFPPLIISVINYRIEQITVPVYSRVQIAKNRGKYIN